MQPYPSPEGRPHCGGRARDGRMSRVALAARLARRELRSGLSGFRIFFACLVLGVAAIAGVGSLSEAFLTGLADTGRTLLGGGVGIRLVPRQKTPGEHAF